ncbi:cache domain-containing protein [Pseudomonas sp. 5P_3.1_Bac2]|uniref:PDC sensor domain-containing protein n=1 Tax=Pseudomonas sp. 5P_3.1_Bac2 TaxID=2971617 RepID=UPI0021C5E16C|nr:cache domain-containing protein [Pseudomonas sp. 5P_3.1_Bac2]MCU1717161.1 cache domain-containing protein [Pseudomonas sp. 5P_3.1_Bac2]
MFAQSDNDPLSICVAQLDSTLGAIFSQVRHLVEENLQLWERVIAEGRQPDARDLALLRPAIEQMLQACGTFGCGGGVVVEPGCLGDRKMHLEWWHLVDGGKTLPLRPNFDRNRENFYDYTEMLWYSRPRDLGKSVVEGPYIDLYGTNMYVLTFTVPMYVQGRFIGVAGLDLSLHNVERLLIQSLMRLENEALLLAADGRVIASNTPNWMIGDLAQSLLQLAPELAERRPLGAPDAGWSLVHLPGLRAAA